MDYQQKYLKYKEKYITLRNSMGGAKPAPVVISTLITISKIAWKRNECPYIIELIYNVNPQMVQYIVLPIHHAYDDKNATKTYNDISGEIPHENFPNLSGKNSYIYSNHMNCKVSYIISANSNTLNLKIGDVNSLNLKFSRSKITPKLEDLVKVSKDHDIYIENIVEQNKFTLKSADFNTKAITTDKELQTYLKKYKSPKSN